MNRERLERLMAKTATMLNRLDSSIPANIYSRARVDVRHEFFGDGYAISNPTTDAAVATARDALGLRLEPTYTGKAMAALLHDAMQPPHRDAPLLFWNTYNSNPLPEMPGAPVDFGRLPAEFLHYFD